MPALRKSVLGKTYTAKIGGQHAHWDWVLSLSFPLQEFILLDFGPMKLGSRHCFATRLVLLYLTMLLGVRGTAWATSNTDNSQPPLLKKPTLLEPVQTTQEDPWVRLNTLVVKQRVVQCSFGSRPLVWR
jgi:hypothetical protein